MKKLLNVGIVGATGLIGGKFVEVLQKRNFPVKDLRLFATEKSKGKNIFAFGKNITVETVDKDSFLGLDIVFFSAGANVSKLYVPQAIKDGAWVIDNSSAFRSKEEIPLIIPEINGKKLKNYNGKIISNPNCSTAIGILPLSQLVRLYGVKRIIFTTYQAVSGSGKKGVDDLKNCKLGLLPKFYLADISNNCIAKIGSDGAFGYTAEELKMINETQKIFGKKIKISSTCVRVPIENCHGVSVEVELKKSYEDEDIKSVFRSAKGVKVTDLPLFEMASGKDEVFVGRIKRSLAFKNGISYFCIGDNTLKGASLNAVQIAELLIKYNKF